VETNKVVSGEELVSSVVRLVLGPGVTNNLRGETVESLSLPPLSQSSPPLDCEASWDLELPDLQSVFSVSAQWTGGQDWSCVFSPTSSSVSPPASPATIALRVLNTRHSLTYLPAIAVSQTSLEVGEAGAVIKVSGHPAVLDLLQTRHTEGLQLGSAWVEGEELHLPVSLTAPHYSVPPSVSISVPATGQTVTVTILPLISACGQTTGFLSAVAANLLKYYQTVLCIIVSSLLAGYITRTQLARAASKPPVPAPVPATPTAAKHSPEKVGDSSQNASSPYLWTVDNNPIYGSPIYRRSPPSQPRNLAQYSYT